MNTVEKAWIPPELEKASTHKPNKKATNKRENLFSLIGYKKIKTI